MGERRGRFRESDYRGFRSVVMESNEVKVILIPELGGKIVSLLYKPGAKEWLVDPGTRELKRVDYGSSFAAADMSGWDECFPTIVACTYPFDGAYKDAMLPDHGELWSVPWHVHMEEEALVCGAAGRALPYEFTRRMYFLDERTVRFEYEVTSLSDETISVLWAAHPQFLCTEHTRIRLPEGTERLLCVDGGRSLEAGCRYLRPADCDRPDDPFTRIGPASLRDCRKYYIDGPVHTGRCGLYEQNSGNYVTLEWQPEVVPYLGVWIDEGAFSDRPVCALEPSSGYYDKLTEAGRRGALLRIGAGQKAGWKLDVRLG